MNKHIRRFACFVRMIARPVYPIKVYGDKNIKVKKSILVGNHLTALDAIMMYMVSKEHIHFMYKAELEKSKFLRTIFTGLDLVPVHRGEADMNATKQCLRTLKKDQVLTLFPEGTRNVNVDCLQEFKTGAALFAIKTKAPIRPFYIWEKAKPFRRNRIIIGEEFELSEYYGQTPTKAVLIEATQKIYDSVDALRIKLNGILEAKGVKRRKRTKKELAKISEYNKQLALAKVTASSDGADE